MIRLIELCVKGELFFFENNFSSEELAQIEALANIYFLKEDACISNFADEVRKKLSLIITIAKIERVIAI